ncbi:MAG: bL35 family ribosomal protein [Nitrospiraceae bacterium]
MKLPKTHSGAKKRFKRTGTGKLVRKSRSPAFAHGKGTRSEAAVEGFRAGVADVFTLAVNRILPSQFDRPRRSENGLERSSDVCLGKRWIKDSAAAEEAA